MEIRVEIPFSGFYCSFHDDNIDRALDSMFSDRATNKAALAELARERFTSRDGFISFYDPDVKNWGAFNTWDVNQYGLLLAAYAQQENYTGDFDQYAEHSLTEDFSGNGWLDNWLCDACPISNRLFRIFDYLESRKERGAQ